MTDYNFENVNVVLVDSDRNLRQTLRDSLHHFGFTDIRVAGSLTEFRECVELIPPDLVICDMGLPDGQLTQFIYAIRHNEISTNPFFPVIILTWNPSQELVRKIVDSGTDDLLVKPIAPAVLLERIKALIHSRKPFVVTSDYIGPDRRTDLREESAIPLVDVPNPLKAKTTDDPGSFVDQDSVDEAIARINLQKLERHSLQIDELVGEILAGYEKNVDSETTRGRLGRLIRVTKDVQRRIVGTRHDHVAELCQSLLRIATLIRANHATPDAKNLELLPQLNLAIKGAFAPDRNVAAAAHDISTLIKSSATG